MAEPIDPKLAGKPVLVGRGVGVSIAPDAATAWWPTLPVARLTLPHSSEARRFGMSTMRLDDFKAIRKVHGGTINDVVLAACTLALRRYMIEFFAFGMHLFPAVDDGSFTALIAPALTLGLFVSAPAAQVLGGAITRTRRVTVATMVRGATGGFVITDEGIRLGGPVVHIAEVVIDDV